MHDVTITETQSAVSSGARATASVHNSLCYSSAPVRSIALPPAAPPTRGAFPCHRCVCIVSSDCVFPHNISRTKLNMPAIAGEGECSVLWARTQRVAAAEGQSGSDRVAESVCQIGSTTARWGMRSVSAFTHTDADNPQPRAVLCCAVRSPVAATVPCTASDGGAGQWQKRGNRTAGHGDRSEQEGEHNRGNGHGSPQTLVWLTHGADLKN